MESKSRIRRAIVEATNLRKAVTIAGIRCHLSGKERRETLSNSDIAKEITCSCQFSYRGNGIWDYKG